MQTTIFREKSIQRVSSPEQLNDYIKVSNPAVWLSLLAIILFFVGAFAWGVLGHIETVQQSIARVSNGATICYATQEQANKLQIGQVVRINDAEGTISEIELKPIKITADFDDYAMHLGGIKEGDWLVPVSVNIVVPDGVYKSEIITESISPIIFLLN